MREMSDWSDAAASGWWLWPARWVDSTGVIEWRRSVGWHYRCHRQHGQWIVIIAALCNSDEWLQWPWHQMSSCLSVYWIRIIIMYNYYYCMMPHYCWKTRCCLYSYNSRHCPCFTHHIDIAMLAMTKGCDKCTIWRCFSIIVRGGQDVYIRSCCSILQERPKR